jgi:CBS domain-containing protein
MQTAAIPYRVADFLKQHPPFQFMDEPDLVALAGRGRVKFHEPDEYICWQNSPHTSFIYVIQQGSVSLWDESVNPPALRDIRGAGDMIGIERFNGSATSLHSAKAACEVVLYALHAADFELLLPRYPRATQYVAAHSAVTADYQAPGERLQPHEIFLADLLGDRAPLQCLASTPICEAARLLNESGSQALALATEGGQLAALLTPADLLRWIAAGAANPEQPARAIAPTILVTVAPQISVADCVLAMAEARSNAAAVASEASPHAAIHNIVTAPILAPAFGDHPSNILQEIAFAPRIETLRELNERARAWILQSLVAPSALDWLASFADLVNRRILERLLQIAGYNRPEQLWCFYGAAGRRELLTFVAPSIAIFGDAPASLSTALAECGYLSPEPLAAGSLDEWKARFSGWIGDPIRTQVYQSRPFFDLRPVQGPERLFRELQSHIRAELNAEPSFLRILAHDCLANLPPLTFFRDLVVEESGEQTEIFRLENSALQPLADVARVFGLACGTPLGSSTRMRFEQARLCLPSQESIFHEAAETMRVVLFHQARAGLRLRSSGATLPLSILSRHDRQVLKSGFRSIHDLLEITAPCDWLEAL